jgi:hypothetical protein
MTPQGSMAQQSEPSRSGPSAKQMAGEAVVGQMRIGDVAYREKRELTEAERMVVGGVDIDQLLKASKNPQEIIKMITPHTEEQTLAAAVWGGPVEINDLRRSVAENGAKQADQRQAHEDMPSNGVASAAVPAYWQNIIDNTSDEDWAAVDITADDDAAMYEALDNLPDSFLNDLTKSALVQADNEQQGIPFNIFQGQDDEFGPIEQFPDQEEFSVDEVARASEFQRQMDMMAMMDGLPDGVEAAVWKGDIPDILG